MLIAPPKAGSLIESLRGIGYTPATALADIIDNSISAKSNKVDVKFEWAGKKSKIFILDNGSGMDAEELIKAMMLGEHNPNDKRKEYDLGRFGLGLKTGSFSQCRRLTVISAKNGNVNSLYWDLDIIADDPLDRWILNEGIPSSLDSAFNEFKKNIERGTLVCWEVLDRIITKNYQQSDYLDLIDSVERHLSMVFHRFIDGVEDKLNLSINGQPLKGWDPFMQGNISKPWHSGIASHPLDPRVQMECHVLPHKDRLNLNEYENYQGPDGWTAQQGFYVYRGKRMLVSGGWLGLGGARPWTKDESHRLARIRLDIPIEDDLGWKIDIKKATARPPIHLREWLSHMAEITRLKARNVFAQRGFQSPKNKETEIFSIWTSSITSKGQKYSIDLSNPTLNALLSSLGDRRSSVISLLKLIEETVPVQKIWLDTEIQRDTPINNFVGEPSENITNVLKELFFVMTTIQGKSVEDALNTISRTDPFQNYPDLIESLR